MSAIEILNILLGIAVIFQIATMLLQKRNRQYFNSELQKTDQQIMAQVPAQIHAARSIEIRAFWLWFSKTDYVHLGTNDFRTKTSLQQKYTLDYIVREYLEATKDAFMFDDSNEQIPV